MKNAVRILKSGGVGVLPTDTIYGIVGSALSKKSVIRIYKLRKRNPKKPLIILINTLKDLDYFGIKLDRKTKKILHMLWPGPISVILDCPSRKFAYLHRGTKTLAFRLSKQKNLQNLIQQTGPLVAPSANWEGHPPAKTTREAKNYFGTNADFYIDAGKLDSLPSTLVRIKKGKIEMLREGLGMKKVLKVKNL